MRRETLHVRRHKPVREGGSQQGKRCVCVCVCVNGCVVCVCVCSVKVQANARPKVLSVSADDGHTAVVCAILALLLLSGQPGPPRHAFYNGRLLYVAFAATVVVVGAAPGACIMYIVCSA